MSDEVDDLLGCIQISEIKVRPRTHAKETIALALMSLGLAMYISSQGSCGPSTNVCPMVRQCRGVEG